MRAIRARWSGWRLALRLARREALRARGRSVLVLVMISLPVLAVVATAVLATTIDVNLKEGVDRKIGTRAAALITAEPRVDHVVQGIDPTTGGGWSEAPHRPAATPAQIERVIGHRPRLRVELDGYVPVRSRAGIIGGVQLAEMDPTDPLAAGLFRLAQGRWPRSRDEIVVNAYLAGRGPGLGRTLSIPSRRRGGSEQRLTVVGIAESTRVKNAPAALALPGTVRLPGESGATSWLVGGGPIPWSEVRALNKIGVTALSRAVVEDPPPAAVAADSSSDGTAEVYALVAVMALIEVVLLAGPAFAVGARRQSRTLALLAASGSTPRQSRRVILASGIVLGLAAAAVGVVGGIGLARLIEPVVQDHSGDWLGPFEIPWLLVAVIALFGVASALLAAVVPAWIASRQDVVAVLSGRRGDRKPSLRSPLIGLAVLALGIAGAVMSTRRTEGGETYIAGAAVLCVLGMVFLVPIVVAAVGRLAARLPLPLRFAVRDAARHRTRTAPAVAAVAATVAGVVALGIGNASDEKQSRETYTATLPMGEAIVHGQATGRTDWTKVRELVGRYAPHASVTPVTGVPEDYRGRSSYLTFRAAGVGEQSPASFGGYGAAALLSRDGSMPGLLAGPDGVARRVDPGAARRVLREGGVVVFTSGHPRAHESVVHLEVDDDQAGRVARHARVRLPALFVHVGPDATVPAAAVVSPGSLHRLGLRSITTALLLDGGVSEAAEADLTEALRASGTGFDYPTIYVERGYQADSSTWLIQLILAGLAAVLMMGGTLTATFLALSDARPDLATLAAVGAAPRTRRGIAAAYAVVVALIGAVLGALVGLVPGIAVTYPLTRGGQGVTCYGNTCSPDGTSSGPFLDIPWLLIAAVVIGLPLLMAGVVAATTRGRLPLVARLD